MTMSPSEKPTHYSRLDPQPVEVIEAWGLGFHLGSVLKYIGRATHKGDEVRDIKKAIWYLKRHLQVKEALQQGKRAPTPEAQE